MSDLSAILDVPAYELGGDAFMDRSAYGHKFDNHNAVWQAQGFYTTNGTYWDGHGCLKEEYTALTISQWFKPTSFTPARWRTPLHRGVATSVGGSVFFVALRTADNVIISTIGAAAGAGYEAGNTGVAAQLGQWYNAICSWDGADANVYVNGKWKRHYAFSSFANQPTAHTHIGTSGTYHFDGVIGETMIWRRALTARDAMNYHDTTKWRYV